MECYQAHSKVSVSLASDNLRKSSCCLGADTLLTLLGNYCHSHGIKTSITIGVVGTNYYCFDYFNLCIIIYLQLYFTTMLNAEFLLFSLQWMLRQVKVQFNFKKIAWKHFVECSSSIRSREVHIKSWLESQHRKGQNMTSKMVAASDWRFEKFWAAISQQRVIRPTSCLVLHYRVFGIGGLNSASSSLTKSKTAVLWPYLHSGRSSDSLHVWF